MRVNLGKRTSNFVQAVYDTDTCLKLVSTKCCHSAQFYTNLYNRYDFSDGNDNSVIINIYYIDIKWWNFVLLQQAT